MVNVQTSQYGERLINLFTRARGSNFMEHAPLGFEATGEKGDVDHIQLRKDYIQLFQDIANSALGRKYDHSIAPVPGINEFGNPIDSGKLVVHPEGVRLLESKHDYYFNQWAFLYEGRDDFPLILLEPFDFRKPKFNENRSSVSLRFIYGTLENKQKIFDFFEGTIRLAGMPYERQYPRRSLESLNFDFEFDQAQLHLTA